MLSRHRSLFTRPCFRVTVNFLFPFFYSIEPERQDTLSVQSQLSLLQLQKAELEKKLAQTQTQLHRLSSEYESKYRQLESKIHESQSLDLYNASLSQIAELKEEKAKMDMELISISEKYNNERLQWTQLSQEYEKSYQDSQQLIHSLTAEKESLSRTIQDLTAQLSAIQEVSDDQTDSNNLSNYIKELSELKMNLENEIAIKESQDTRIRELLDQIQLQESVFNQKIQEYEEKYIRMEQDFEFRVSELKDALQRLEIENEELKRSKLPFTDSSDAFSSNETALLAQLEQTAKDYEKQLEDISVLNQLKLKEKDSEIEIMRNQINLLKSELEDVNEIDSQRVSRNILS